MGVAAIPWTAMLKWFRHNRVDDYATRFGIRVLREVDCEMVARANKK